MCAVGLHNKRLSADLRIEPDGVDPGSSVRDSRSVEGLLYASKTSFNECRRYSFMDTRGGGVGVVARV